MRRTRIAALFLTVLAASAVLPTQEAAAVDIPGVVHNPTTDTYYKLYTSTVTWAQAKQAAIALGGYLATITSSSENSFIVSNVGITTDSWIGATDEATEGTWVWVTGESWSYTNWNSGEPNNSNNEDYCTIRTDGRWNDLNGSQVRPYIVEWSENPNGPPAAPTDLSASVPAEDEVDLAWTDHSTRESTFEVERSTAGGAYAQIAVRAADTTAYIDTDVAAETQYDYRVRASNANGPSEYTNVATVVTPSPPVEDLEATPLSATAVQLAWTDVASEETGYRVERGDGADATSFTVLTTLPPDSTGYTDAAATQETTYTYQVRSLGPDGSPSSSPAVTVTTLPGPPSYLGLSTPDGPHVVVEWQDSSATKTSFQIERRNTAPATAWTPLAGVGALLRNYEDATVTPETAYAYRIRTNTTLGDSVWSEEKQIVTPPHAPSDVLAERLSTNHVRLSWTDNAVTEKSFSIVRATLPGGEFTTVASLGRNATSYDDTSVTQEGAYAYRISAIGAIGRSDWTETDGAVELPAALTISTLTIKAGKAKGKKVKPSQLDVRGVFDTGTATVSLSGPTTIDIGDFSVAIPSLSVSRKVMRYTADGVSLTLFPRTDTSRVAFALRVTGEIADGLDPDGEVTLRYTQGTFVAEGTVQLASGRFQAAKAGRVVEPPIDITALAVKLTSGVRDRLKARGVFDIAGGTPEAAPTVTVQLGLLSFRTLPTNFTRTGDRWTYKGADDQGKAKLTLDYAKGQYSISLSSIDVGEFDRGRVPVAVEVAIDGVVFGDTPVLSNNGSSMGY